MKHREIYSSLSSSIRSGHYQPGARLPTEVELCRQFDVSRPTVARAMRELQHEGLIERRAGDGTYVRKEREVEETLSLGLLIPELGCGEIFDPICVHLSHVAQQQQMRVVWGTMCHSGSRINQGRIDVTPDEATTAADVLLSRGVAGVFFAPLTTGGVEDIRTNSYVLGRFREAGVAVVLLDRDIEVFPKRSEYDVVAIDHIRGQYIATQHAIGSGCRQLVYLRWSGQSDSIHRREIGFIAAVRQAAVSDLDARVVCGDPRDKACLQRLLGSGSAPHAILCENDLIASLLIKQLNAADLVVPDDMLVIGFNDLRATEEPIVPLTTVRQPFADIGDLAVDAMRFRLASTDAKPRDFFVNPTLVTRRSTGFPVSSQ